MNNSSFFRAASSVLLALVIAGCSNGSDTVVAPAAQTAISRNLDITVEQSAELPGYNIYRPANLDATGAPLPVIVWASGGCFRIDSPWKILLDSWAKAGFVTLAPITLDGGDPRTAGPTTVADQITAIDWIVSENARAGSRYAGHFDLDRIVAAGNSCGGIVALNLAAIDNRVHSVFVLSGSSVFPGASREAAAAVMGNVLVPVGYAIGGPTDISTGMVKQDYEVLPVGVPAYVARRFEYDHPTVSTDAGALSEVAQISTNWIDFTLYGNAQAMETLLEKPCGTCAPGTWTIEAKDLDLIVAQ